MKSYTSQVNENEFKTDYLASSLVKAFSKPFIFFVTPRFLHHYNNDNGYEPATIRIFQELIRPGSTVIDVGAHYGYYSLVAAHKVGKKGRVIAVEPVPFNGEVLEKNIIANDLSKTITLKRLAVSDKLGTASFNITEASDNAGFYNHPSTRIIEKLTVKTTTLDNLFNGEDISVVKVDAEGHENEIISTAQTLLKSIDTAFFLEFNPKCFVAAGHKPEEILQGLLSSKHRVFVVNEASHELVRLHRSSDWKKLLGSKEYRNILIINSQRKINIRALSKRAGLAYSRGVGLRKIFSKD